MLKLFVEGGVYEWSNKRPHQRPESPTDMRRFLTAAQLEEAEQIVLPIGFALVKAANDELHIIEH